MQRPSPLAVVGWCCATIATLVALRIGLSRHIPPHSLCSLSPVFHDPILRTPKSALFAIAPPTTIKETQNMLIFILATAFITAITVSLVVANCIVRRHVAETA